MAKYFLKRVAYGIVTLFVLVTLTFFMQQLLPGGPFTGDKNLPEATMEALYAKYGLDKPLALQYLIYLGNCIHEPVLREYRHLQTCSTVCHTVCIQVRTEYNGLSLLCRIGLHPLKAGLCILKHAGTLAHSYHRIGNQSSLIPGPVLIIGNKSLVCLHIAKPKVCPVNIFFLHFGILQSAFPAIFS